MMERNRKKIVALLMAVVLLGVIVQTASAGSYSAYIPVNSDHIKWIKVVGTTVQVAPTHAGYVAGVDSPYGFADEVIREYEDALHDDFPWSRKVAADEISIHCWGHLMFEGIAAVQEHTKVIDIDNEYPFKGIVPWRWFD